MPRYFQKLLFALLIGAIALLPVMSPAMAGMDNHDAVHCVEQMGHDHSNNQCDSGMTCTASHCFSQIITMFSTSVIHTNPVANLYRSVSDTPPPSVALQSIYRPPQA